MDVDFGIKGEKGSVRGSNTRSAISCGVATMFTGFVQEHVAQAVKEWGSDFQVICRW